MPTIQEGPQGVRERFAFEAALAELAGDLDCLRDIAGMYEQELAARQRALRDAASDGPRLIPLLHEVANTLAVVVAPVDAGRVRALERRLRDGAAVAEVGLDVASVCAAMQQVHEALQQWLRGRPS